MKVKCYFCKKKKVFAGNMCVDCFDHYQNIRYKILCEICGYSKCKSALDIHHVDLNHNNNFILNLLCLCANCHRQLHHGCKDDGCGGLKYLEGNPNLVNFKEILAVRI